MYIQHQLSDSSPLARRPHDMHRRRSETHGRWIGISLLDQCVNRPRMKPLVIPRQARTHVLEGLSNKTRTVGCPLAMSKRIASYDPRLSMDSHSVRSRFSSAMPAARAASAPLVCLSASACLSGSSVVSFLCLTFS